MRGWFAAALSSSSSSTRTWLSPLQHLQSPPLTTSSPPPTSPSPLQWGGEEETSGIGRQLGDRREKRREGRGRHWLGSDSVWSQGRERGWNYSTVTSFFPSLSITRGATSYICCPWDKGYVWFLQDHRLLTKDHIPALLSPHHQPLLWRINRINESHFWIICIYSVWTHMMTRC